MEALHGGPEEVNDSPGSNARDDKPSTLKVKDLLSGDDAERAELART
jgi:hypothetical protein